MNTNSINFPLYGYVTSNQQILSNLNGMEVRKTNFQNEHKSEYLIAQYINNKIHGEARLYDNGLLKLRWTCENGVQYGKFYVYEKGMLQYTSVCPRGQTWNGSYYIKNEETNRWLYIHDPVTKELEYIGEYAKDEMTRKGWGVEYEKGRIKRCGLWEKNELVQVEKIFQGGEMIEYTHDLSCHDNLEIPHVVYVGEYSESIPLHFPRHGKGRIINPVTGIVTWCGEFNMNKKVTGFDCDVDGWYTSSENNKELLRINNTTELLFSVPFVESMDIADNSCCEQSLSVLDFSTYPFLSRIKIGNNCFVYTKVFKIVNNCNIQSISIGNFCFMPKKIPGNKEDCLFLLNNLSQLSWFAIGIESFAQYSHFTINSKK